MYLVRNMTLELLLKSPICRFRSDLHKILLEMGGGGFCEFNNNPELLLNKFHPRYSLGLSEFCKYCCDRLLYVVSSSIIFDVA